MSLKPLLPGLTALLLAGPVLAQSSPSAPTGSAAAATEPAADPQPLAPSAPSVPSVAGDAPATSRLPAANARRDGTRMLGAGAFDTSPGLEGALNSGTPSLYDRKSGPRKVCPPGLENRNNLCAPPIGSVLSN